VAAGSAGAAPHSASWTTVPLIPPVTRSFSNTLLGQRAAVLAAVAGTVVLADQLTKTWAEHALADGPIHLFWTISLRLTYNSGAAFSSGRGLTPFITALAVVVLIALVGFSRSMTTTIGLVTMGLVIGGAMGNLTDRFVRDNGGAVIDFVDFEWWPVWNIADAAIVIGAILLIFSRAADRS
jgi:signal peptidase II